MAKPKAGFATKTKSQNYSTKWLRNALKSVGISSQEALKEISPNIYEVTSSGVNVSRNIINSLRRNKGSGDRIGEALKSNKYVQYAQKAYRNAMSDIKTGNFNNQERMNQAMDSSFSGDIEDLKEGFSFGDDGANESGNVNVNYINNGASNGAMLHLSNQMQEQTKAQLKVQKASMDAYIAVNAASMQQVGQIGSEIVGQLANVNNNLSALVQYQNDNMTKFIEASLAYYEHAGASMGAGKNGSSPNSKMSARDVLNSSAGGINMGRYKSYVKQQAKDLFDHSNIGLLKSLADDPMMMDMIVSNPIGFLSQGLIGHMIPTVLKTSLEAMETTLTNFMPTMLSKLGDLADTEGSDFVSKFKRVIGKTFGLRTERTTSFGKMQINRDAIPFDGETKHAITEIITKELRDQSGYLEIIANHFTKGKAKELARSNGEYWSYNKNGYIKREDIDIEIADKIVDSIRSAFNDTKFGKDIKANLIDNRKTESAKKEMAFTIDELFVEIEKHKGHVTLDDLMTMIEHGGASNKTKNTIKDYIKKMSYQNRGAFDSLSTAKINSHGAAEETRQSIMNDYVGNNLFNSSFSGDANVDEILEQVKKYGKWSDKGSRNVRGINKYNKNASTDSTSGTPKDHQGKLLSMFQNASSGAVSLMQTIMSGDTQGVIDKGAEFISNGLKSIGTKLQEYSQKEGGIIWQVKENFSTMGTEIKDGIMSKFFGKKRDEKGNYVKDESEKGGLFGSVSKFFTDGFNNWIDAFFGKDEKDPEKAREEHKRNIVAMVKDALPNAITGGLVGRAIGFFAKDSVLGMLVGGPFGGMVLGAATGFLAKNEKFQQWLFGKDNEDGSHTEGLISKKIQDYYKENKTKLIGGAAVGAVTGGITGGGLLGVLVGGPLAGSIMGMATTVVANSDMFKKFLFGDQEKGQKGLFKAVADAFNKGFKKTGGENTADGGKTLGMGAIGAGAGALTSAIIAKMGVLGASFSPLGPIGGALAGFALSIKAQSGNFRKWLFGEEDGLDLGDGRKVKKHGVLGQIGNQLTVSIINPMKHEIEFIAKDFMSTVKYKVLAPFSFFAETVSGKFGELFGKISEQINGAVSGVVSFAKDTVKSLFAPITNAIGGIMKTATNFTWKAMKHIISTPGNIAVAAIKALGIKEKFNEWKPIKFLKNLGKDIRKLVFDGIKGVFKLIGNVAAAPFKLLGFGISKLWSGTKNLAGKLTEGAREKFKNSNFGSKFLENYREITRGSGTEDDTIIQRMARSRDEYKKEQKEIKEAKERNKIHDKNANLLSKFSGKQFKEDSEEARTWLKNHRPDLYKKLDLSVKSTTAEINGESTIGKKLSDINDIDSLSEEGKQTKLLYDIEEEIKDFFSYMKGNKRKNKKDNQTSNDEVKDNETQEENTEDETENEDKVYPSTGAKLGDDLRNYVKHIGSYFKNNFFKNTRNFFKKEEPDAATLSDELDMPIEGHSIGGKIKKGLSIVGEKGAEFIYKTKDGITSVLDTVSSAEILNTKEKGKKKSKLKKWINGIKQNFDNEPIYTGKNASISLNPSLMESLNKSKNQKQLQKEKEEEKAKEEQKKYQDEMLKATKENNDSSKKYHKTWDKLWNPKKGLLMIAGIAAFAWLKKKLPGVFDAIGTMAKGILQFLGGALGETIKDISWTEQNAARTDGNTVVEQAGKVINDFQNGNIITDATGEATQRTEPMMKVLARTGLNFINSKHHLPFESKLTRVEKGVFNAGKWVGDKVGKAGKWIGGKAGNWLDSGRDLTKLQQAGSAFLADGVIEGGITKSQKLASKVSGVVDNVAAKGKSVVNKVKAPISKFKNKVVNKVSNVATDAGSLITHKATKNDGLLSKVCKYIDDFFSFIKDKFAKKAGQELAEGALGKVSKKGLIGALKNSWDNICGKLAAKIAAVTGKGVGLAAVSFGLSEVIGATIGAVNSVSGTAKLFQVSEDQIDGTMKLIAGIFGALTGTTIGGIIDVILSILGEVMGCDILHSLAVAMYNIIVGKDSKKAKKLESAQASFKEAYVEERNAELEKQYETQKKAGIIGEDVTLDMFIQGVQDGTYEASYTSFQDWNVQKNKSIGDKIGSFFGKAWKGTKNVVKGAGKFLFGGKETQYKDKNGNTYTENSDGTWQVKDANGKDLGSVSKKAIPSDAEKIETKTDNILKRGAKAVGKLGKKVGSAAKKAGKAIANTAKKGWNSFTSWITGKKDDDKDENKKDKTEFKNKIKSLGKSLFEKGASVIEKAKTAISSVTDKAAGIYNEIKEKGVSGFIGGLFKKEKISVWEDPTNGSYYKIEKDGTYSYYNINGDLLEEKIEASKVEEMKKAGILVEGEIKGDSKLKKALSGLKETLAKGWDKAKETVKSAWSNIKSFFSGGKGSKNVSSGGKGLQTVSGGKGPDMLNGQPYFSQNDSRWGNKPYTIGEDKATMSDTGCGPTAMAMIASSMGRNFNPVDMAKLAKLTGNRDSTGTNSNFINQVSPMLGMTSQQKLNPTAKDIDKQLSSGNPVLLLGGSGSDPFTKSGHYVVAVGKDSNNNIIINDPRGKGYSKAYNLNSVAKKTSSSWAFGGRGPETSGVTPRDQWVAVVKLVKRAIAEKSPGYSQTNWINIKVLGKTLSMRTDCSGFIAVAAKYYGAISDETNLSTSNMLDERSPLGSRGCFRIARFPGWDNLEIGDILVKNGHTEVYAGKIDGKYYVYNCGSNASVNNPDATPRSYDTYSYIWVPVKANVGVTNSTSSSSTNASTTTAAPTITTNTESASTNSSNSFSDLTSYLGSFFSEFSSRALSGNYNTDYSNISVKSSSNDSTASTETTDGGSGIGLSRRDRTRLKNAKRISKGGRGTVDYSSTQSIQSRKSSNQYNLAGNVQKYITVTKDSSMNALMLNAIEILAAIAGNTSDTSMKLNALNNLQKLSISGGNSTNVIVGSDGKTKILPTNNPIAESRDTVIAKQMARGGY